jgi:aryl-alcohol dehydrogenase-like predicted oxidoreductase
MFNDAGGESSKTLRGASIFLGFHWIDESYSSDTGFWAFANDIGGEVRMKRREFLRRGAYRAAGAALVGSAGLGASGFGARMAALPELDKKMEASDTVTLGKTGIKTSRLAMGTGTNGIGHHSRQTDQLGISGLSALLQNGYDNGLRFFDLADAYGSHPHAADALKHVPRDKVTVMTKSWSRDPTEMKADLDRYRKELGTEYLDIVLMHCLSEGDWTKQYRGVMDVLSEAKQKGIIRAHGCSCHSIEALRAAAKSPWVEIDLVRMNPIGSHMDSDPETVAAVIREMRAEGKGIIGMKILGQGDMRNRQDDALKYALSMGLLDAFTIGAENEVVQMDLIARIQRAA